ncbi:MAG: KPN_02809 family neutral zinc metallopeptidase [Tepidiformaceae bacterium]
MKLRGSGGRSGNLEDRRGQRSGLGMGGLPIGKGGLPLLIIMLISLFFGGRCALDGGGGGGGFDIGRVLEELTRVQAPAPGAAPLPGAPDPDAELVDFVSFVLDDVQTTWEEKFTEAGKEYRRATLVLFTDGTNSGCGQASAASGPFYCPPDETVYIDLAFFNELQARFGAPGDFAQAYVIAHEIAHHVQKLTGVNSEVATRSQRDPGKANDLSIRQELQADCLAGVWAHSTYERGLLESGDLEEGLGAAAAVGDDRIQREGGGRVNPETWTHGSSEQRTKWFTKGFDSGDSGKCDTFSGSV